MLTAIIFFLAFVLTFAGVKLFRRISLNRNILDLPNERSSHSQPTPIGGGIAIVIVTISLYLIGSLVFGYSAQWAFIGGALIIAAISWLDDLFSVPIVLRFSFHTVAAALAIWGIGGTEALYIPFYGQMKLFSLGAVLSFFWIVWMINAYNFMDGIDGIAGTQALTAGLGWFAASFFTGTEMSGLLGGIIAFSSLGFLILNWQPAKIFMGDVGSAFLGYCFGVLPFLAQSEAEGGVRSMTLVIGVFMVWLFVIDTLVTVIKRAAKGKRIWHAHREHLYQQLVIRGYSHRFVTLLYGAVSLFVVGLVIMWLNVGYSVELFNIAAVIIITISLFLFGHRSERKNRTI